MRKTVWSSIYLSKRWFGQCSTGHQPQDINSEQNQPAIQIDLQETSLLPSYKCGHTRPSTEMFYLLLSKWTELEEVPPLSPLEEITEDEAVQIDADLPIPQPLYTAGLCDQSETLRKLFCLVSVDLSKIEKRRNVANFLLKLDFERDVTKILLFLKDVGLEDELLGAFLTKNPFILTEDLENLQKRVSYLALKNSARKELGLSAEKTRDLIIRLPRLVTGSLEPVQENLKVCEIELGFNKNEIQHIATRIPKMLTANKKKLTETFDYVHNNMGIPHHILVKFPQIFNTKLLKIKERHQFLTYLGRAIYDPAQPNYVSLDKMVFLPDEVFCDEVAKTNVEDYEKFLKTL
ncbi:hypothetical protein GDO86_010813 [Hymenochirus boettgeri]|uniref:Mitochondrial transcription termination factor 3 n=1 Tax=Hymenochirus boettgeri TaxID=247094 RepID=A0A8T2J954_9PIPI|nr:hypothetical protein GDO86_010813 [Hymenochirus boettgeri]